MAPRLVVKMLTPLRLKNRPEEQASTCVQHISEPGGTFQGQRRVGSIFALPLPHTKAPVSPRRDLFSHVSAALIFAAAPQGIPRDCLTLEPKGACIPGLMGL